MPEFSANLGFLWTELSLPDAIRAAKAAGFSAVECHWPYETDPGAVKAALDDTGLPMLGLNTSRGAPGENGLAALVGREAEARAAIEEALGYATAIGASAVHVMAGFADGPKARAVFLGNLRYASARGADLGVDILIEPLNHYDAPGYFLQTTDAARGIIAEVGSPNLKLMFDCYHVQIMEGDVGRRMQELSPIIGHIQIAAVPDRGEPDAGELNYGHVFDVIDQCKWARPVGAEYKPRGTSTEDGLGWMASPN